MKIKMSPHESSKRIEVINQVIIVMVAPSHAILGSNLSSSSDQQAATIQRTNLEDLALSNVHRTIDPGQKLKVLSVGNGKIPTKKVKVSVCHRETVKI